jgi:tetratricopeptide (TPR) repeat protein
MRGREEDALALGDRASKLARQALAIDPQESSAMLVLASLTRNGWTHELAALPLTTQQRVEASIRIVRRALLADPNNAAALTQLGDYYRRYEFRWTEAERLFRRALAINPSLIDAHWSYGYQLGTTGRALEGLDHALSVFELDSQNLFRRLALPRLLYIAGQRETAMRQYYVYLKQQPDNLFMLRELYLTFISEGNADALAALSDRVRRSPASGAAAADYRILSKRIEAGAEALRGRPGSLLAILNADVSEYESGATRNDATPQGRARDDLPYILSVEYAWAGEPDRSIDMLERALAAKSLYWPPTLPFGPAPYPLAVRSHARYLALWQRDPGLQALIRMRRSALLSGQMAGIDAQGKRFTPTLPPKTALRVRSALKQTLITG